MQVILKKENLLICFSWTTTFILGSAMFVLALIPEDRLHEYPTLIDHILKDGGHLGGFLAFVFVLRLSILLSFGKGSVADYVSFVAGPILAALTEILQLYSPGREPNAIDFVLDLLGALLGAALALMAYRSIEDRRGEK